MDNLITTKVRNTLLTAMFGSVEEFERRRSERKFHEYLDALDFCRSHNVNDENVEVFASMFIRPVVDYAHDKVVLKEGVNIPFSVLETEKTVRSSSQSRGGVRAHKEYGLRDWLYMGMYSAVYKHSTPYRDSILRGDLAAVRAVREEVFYQWKEEVYRLNGKPQHLVDLVEAMTVPRIVQSLWRPQR